MAHLPASLAPCHGTAPSPAVPRSVARPERPRVPRWVPAAAAVAWARCGRQTLLRGQGGAQSSHSSPLCFADSEAMKSLPQFSRVPPEVVEAIRNFAEQHADDVVVTWITGKRVQVYLSGEKSGPFLDYAKEHQHSAVLLSFLETLKFSLSQVASANGGEASPDIAALVGAQEMQVPHTDLLPGQVQVILALTETSSTLVYDPKLPRPSREEVAKMMGVKASELEEEGTFGLLYKSFPLVLPVKEVYQNMVESYSGRFQCGDAVQIRDGIVHAGPGCEDQPDEPRVVIFMTYRTFRDEHYEFTFQAKLWDWASHPAIPPMVAYQRLQEVYRFGVDNGMDIKPWTYYPPESLEACKMLCTTRGLDEMTVELLVEEWRGMLYDENVQIVDQDQEKSALLDAA